MKTKRFRILAQTFLLGAVVSLFTFTACDDDDDVVIEDPIASFQYDISDDNALEVMFTNYSQNASTYAWDFGDGETSTEESPTHVFTESGTYTVKLTVTNTAGVTDDVSKDITLTENAGLLLTGETSKDWRLIREGVSMGIGSSSDNYTEWWSLENDGSRPCVYKQTWTFNTDGTMDFDDGGVFWGEEFVFAGTDVIGTCFEATAANMVNTDGDDVSAWLSGTHDFDYDPSVGTLTLSGTGAWLGLIKVTPEGDVLVPQESVTYDVTITEEDLYDLMVVSITGDGFFWQFNYVSYHDWANEPDVVEEAEEYGEDLEDLTPTEMYNTFSAPDDYVLLDTAAVYPGEASAANGGMSFTIEVTDPAGGADSVGQYDRAGTYQELQFQQDYDIQFDNFTTVSLDVYMPSSNDYTGSLTKDVAIIIGEASQTDGWWNGHIQYDYTVEDADLDSWVTITFNLDSPTSGPGFETYTPFTRDDLDFFAISIGGGGHEDTGTFYIRNFIFE
ncbi:MAG: PKD domain-containing protein [Bacteroidales bacterium]